MCEWVSERVMQKAVQDNEFKEEITTAAAMEQLGERKATQIEWWLLVEKVGLLQSWSRRLSLNCLEWMYGRYIIGGIPLYLLVSGLCDSNIIVRVVVQNRYILIFEMSWLHEGFNKMFETMIFNIYKQCYLYYY